MAVTTIYASTNTNGRGIISVSNSSWSNARGATSGSVSSSSSSSLAVRAGAISGRGGTEYRIARSFAYFDLSSITTTITGATVKVQGAGVVNNGGTMQMYEGTAFANNGSALASTDFDNVTTTSYSSNSFNELNWNKSGQNSFTINSTGISDMNTNGYFNICFRNDKDANNTTPTSDHYLGINFGTSAQSFRIQIDITHNDYDYDVIDVVASNINEIIGVQVDDIDNVINVPPPPP
jgi:uncharacterized protein YkuJ